ncbi:MULTISPECIES: F0F1 ATP synthase subunit epsilon [Exiguobacterium]|jgi:F-type H+-transporting ATPase subunit epsilon|uniref:ATP synthase epsilon chain n=4 Tax=Bacilli TaxID=91061 RepID=ATPE_EXISA|nr:MULTISPECIES: F0F1 ATP synthase subunit epsilon [Exiguobacterium]C4KYS2.1 RecName: Full=ATP synthase epsilon chain; AltName: Full=ATP synthase F1 sector epsilon subunit; AltName: Full=F-ATPase epsilon subunit [Exiguobacterium sp. AT1b]MCC9621846.1 F0F1 ATP synthase subunit epsilon [Thalassospira sp. MA62]QPI68131.1 F0F1 ATP synthase subunit epsilon [Exiguobacterium sp. PBE]ACQ70235.1 ATP synthase F1, epsilon subunit [Exiguobacterium sp. AT1b]MBQ6460293.1 F0F1 ATP synthase subunit epsilon [E
MNTVHVNVVTPDGAAFEGDARMVIAKSVTGELGILPKHIPMVTPLDVSVLKLRHEDGGRTLIAISGGFMEVRPDTVTILAETAEMADKIDYDRASAAKVRAERRLQDTKLSELEFRRAELALKKAINRLSIRDMKE